MSSFTCPTCGRTSANPNDVREGYCGACHAFTGKAALPYPFVGTRKPELGDLVYIDFGDSATSHPEIEDGIVSYISEEFISVLYGHHTHKRFRISNCVHIEVLVEHP